jgi:predicted NACHT family NTPase
MLLGKRPKCFLLYGGPGSGKSTTLQRIAIRQIEKLIHHPQSERIPIFLPMRSCTEDSLYDQMWKLVRRYAKVKQVRFDHWLENGRFVVILDGLDETQHSRATLTRI